MKALLVHKFMRKQFLPFLYEHGLERPMAPVTGIACTNHAGFHIRMGYELGVGSYDWTGNTIQLVGTVSTLGLVKRALLADALQPDDLLPPALRGRLRELGLTKLLAISRLAKTTDAAGRPILPADIFRPMRRASEDPLYVPAFRYQGEPDLAEWCSLVTPFVPDFLASLKEEAEQLRRDARDAIVTRHERQRSQDRFDRRDVRRLLGDDSRRGRPVGSR
jgi:hypothetical protein